MAAWRTNEVLASGKAAVQIDLLLLHSEEVDNSLSSVKYKIHCTIASSHLRLMYCRVMHNVSEQWSKYTGAPVGQLCPVLHHVTAILPVSRVISLLAETPVLQMVPRQCNCD